MRLGLRDPTAIAIIEKGNTCFLPNCTRVWIQLRVYAGALAFDPIRENLSLKMFLPKNETLMDNMLRGTIYMYFFFFFLLLVDNEISSFSATIALLIIYYRVHFELEENSGSG